jgi:AmmeMemoRadiSam system protein A
MIDGRGEALALWARARLKQELGGPSAVPPAGKWADEPGATFVTLRWRDGRLQGCIGSLEPRRSIVNDVAHNAVAAGLHDPRSNPVSLAEVDDLDVEISILSPLEPIAFHDESSALRAIRRGVDGIVFEHRGRRATFLPSMWPRLPGVREFLGELKEKAGLPYDFWDDDVRLYRYTVEKHVA